MHLICAKGGEVGFASGVATGKQGQVRAGSDWRVAKLEDFAITRAEEPTGQVAWDCERIRVLLVDDDSALRSLIRDFLAAEGCDVLEAHDAASARRVLDQAEPDVIVLDVMMPEEDGLSLARSISERGNAAIIMLSALGHEADRIKGLDCGADDYLPKPASPQELLARIRAQVRRRRRAAGSANQTFEFEFNGWRLNPLRRTLRDERGALIGVSDGEFSVLLALVEHVGEVQSRDQLLELSRAGESDAFDRAIDTLVSRLRRKLAARMSGEIIRTVWKEGYVFLPAVSRV